MNLPEHNSKSELEKNKFKIVQNFDLSIICGIKVIKEGKIFFDARTSKTTNFMGHWMHRFS